MERKITNEKTKKIEEIILRASSKMKKNFDNENMVISVYCYNPEMQPRECAKMCNDRYMTSYTGNDVIDIFNGMYMRNVSFRKEVFEDAKKTAMEVLDALAGNKKSIDSIELIMKENKGRIKKSKSRNYERIALVSLLEMCEELKKTECLNKALILNMSSARDAFYSIVDIVRLEAKMMNKKVKNFASNKEYEAEIIRLETNLNRTQMMLERLESEFEERVEECKVEENINLISMLNSPKYGYILDLLLQAQQGVESVRKQRIIIPFEINTLPILVRKLLQFTTDCGIKQMLKYGEKMEVTASDIEGYVYEGTPFADDDTKKCVEVISPGWIVEDKQIVISCPRVKEMEEK